MKVSDQLQNAPKKVEPKTKIYNSLAHEFRSSLKDSEKILVRMLALESKPLATTLFAYEQQCLKLGKRVLQDGFVNQ